MLERIGRVSNPLTIVAIFSAITEVSGVGILPLVATPNQFIYICFLMFFPTLLLLAFFATLNFNHRVLYAPSDWKNEDNFFRLATRKQRAEKLETEIIEAKSIAALENGKELSFAAASTTKSEELLRNPNEYAKLSQAAVRRVSTKYGRLIKEQSIVGPHGTATIFDGIAIGADRSWVLEAKYVSDQRSKASVLETIMKREIDRFRSVEPLLRQSDIRQLGLVLIFIFESLSQSERNEILTEIQKFISRQELATDIKVELLEREDLKQFF